MIQLPFIFLEYIHNSTACFTTKEIYKYIISFIIFISIIYFHHNVLQVSFLWWGFCCCLCPFAELFPFRL
ncbi:hypothetical protein XELAEV_18009455mg [Xenopus laevis]|uniref:Uncharacterized protein n=1 Tax=Xenopus laevis TaxID=8355 RepID=A0A974DSE8_XENLA|nr:hypothetical protein XELAEV_18009455mg [Xenopus laevis]